MCKINGFYSNQHIISYHFAFLLLLFFLFSIFSSVFANYYIMYHCLKSLSIFAYNPFNYSYIFLRYRAFYVLLHPIIKNEMYYIG